MRALRTLLSSWPLAALLGAFALPSAILAGGAAYAAENTPDPPSGISAAAQPSNGGMPTVASPADCDAVQISGSSPAGADALSSSGNVPSAPSPLPTPVIRSAQCPASPLPPHIQRRCAEAAALQEALHAAASALPNRRDIRMGITDVNEYEALAAELYTPLTEVDHAASGGDSGVQVITVTLLARPDASETLLRLLRNPDALQIRRMLLADLASAIASAREIAQAMAEADAQSADQKNISPGSGGTWYIAKATPPGQFAQHPPLQDSGEALRDGALQAARKKADALAANFDAVIAALDALKLSPEGWLTSAGSLTALENAAIGLPRSAATQLLLAEALLQAGMPQRSIDRCTTALELAPGLGRARYIRALAHWRLQQLALAEDDLSAALEATTGVFPHTPDKVRLLRARGALRMLRSNATGMCDDLAAACALGDCDGLAAARQQQLCLTPSKLTTPSSPQDAASVDAPAEPAAPDRPDAAVAKP